MNLTPGRTPADGGDGSLIYGALLSSPILLTLRRDRHSIGLI